MIILDVFAIGVQRGHVGLQNNVDEDWQEVVRARPRGVVVAAFEVEHGENHTEDKRSGVGAKLCV